MDALGSAGWRHYATSERLFDVWGPVAGSPWIPFHCVPLFAALDRIPPGEIGPAEPPDRGAGAASPPAGGGSGLPRHARRGAPRPAWIAPDTWTILDLPGPLSVEGAAWLASSAGCQPVCTFDNWPHPKGVLRPERTLAALLRWATAMAAARARLDAASPPVWICDSGRLGDRTGAPGEFDNRYYLDDSVLPGAGLLATSGIRQVVYVTLGDDDVPLLDLESYFAELLAIGVPVLHLDLSIPAAAPTALAGPIRPRRPPRSGYRRSSAGGFGTEVPEPSSGGGGGG